MAREIGALDLLTTLDEGAIMSDLNRQIHSVLEAVRHSHKKGSVTLTLTVKMSTDREFQRVDVQGDVSAKIPHVERPGERLYLTDECRLSRRNPRQPERPENTIPLPDTEEVDGKSRAAGEPS